MKLVLATLLIVSQAWGANYDPSQAQNCECTSMFHRDKCTMTPAFMAQSDLEIARKLNFDTPEDDRSSSQKLKGLELYQALARFLVRSDRARLFYPEYYTRATKDNSVLTLKSKFIPKNPTEMDEYFRCSIPRDKFCLYRNKLKPFIGLAAKASRIDYSFLACQSYVESRFRHNSESSVGALGYAQIQPSTLTHINKTLHQSIRDSRERELATVKNNKSPKVQKVQKDISRLWGEFWQGTKNPPKNLCSDDLTCYRLVFLAQALALKTDMLTLASSNSGLNVHFNDDGDFNIENMDEGDSLLLLAGSYNVGVTKTTRLVSKYCKGTDKLKECLDRMNAHAQNKKDVRSITTYVTRIRDCAQQYSAEQLDFNDDIRWTTEMRTEKQNQQRDRVASCLLNPCPYRATASIREPAPKK